MLGCRALGSTRDSARCSSRCIHAVAMDHHGAANMSRPGGPSHSALGMISADYRLFLRDGSGTIGLDSRSSSHRPHHRDEDGGLGTQWRESYNQGEHNRVGPILGRSAATVSRSAFPYQCGCPATAGCRRRQSAHSDSVCGYYRHHSCRRSLRDRHHGVRARRPGQR